MQNELKLAEGLPKISTGAMRHATTAVVSKIITHNRLGVLPGFELLFIKSSLVCQLRKLGCRTDVSDGTVRLIQKLLNTSSSAIEVKPHLATAVRAVIRSGLAATEMPKPEKRSLAEATIGSETDG